LSEFKQTGRIATVTGRRIAIVAAFTRLDDEIATTRSHANVWRRHRIADLPARTICILSTDTRIVRRVAKSTGTCIGKRAALPNFAQTGTTATVARIGIAVVASFAHFDNTIATTSRSAAIGIGDDVTELTDGTICIFVACAECADRITETTCTRLRTTRTRLTDFEKTNAIAAVAIRLVVIVASFCAFKNTIATTGNDTDVRIGRKLANWRSDGTIRIFIADTRRIERVTRMTRARR
jgi:hypothetical protein